MKCFSCGITSKRYIAIKDCSILPQILLNIVF
nr:MAG TPA_asm: DNA-directed RNA polymerase [Caudoviricetes sp.]